AGKDVSLSWTWPHASTYQNLNNGGSFQGYTDLTRSSASGKVACSILSPSAEATAADRCSRNDVHGCR
ncbi:MAG: hypothetical protein MZV65_02505, partial [Chromatiales bacterium]|nr:hypothetical protein [Chromatiales bacterium]